MYSNHGRRWSVDVAMSIITARNQKFKARSIFGAYHAAAITVLLLVGCQSTGVVPTGQDSYYIGKKDGSPGLGVSLGNKAAVYREADTFCRQKGLQVRTLNESITPASPGRLGSTELQFKCVPLTGEAQPVAKSTG